MFKRHRWKPGVPCHSVLAAEIAFALYAFSTASSQAAVIEIHKNCSLEDAIIAANTNSKVKTCKLAGPDSDTLVLNNASLLSMTSSSDTHDGVNALPSITSRIVIQGNGATISRASNANSEFRLFHVAEDGDLTLNNITLSGGIASTDGYGSSGGALFNRGRVTLNNTTISNNSATASGGGLRNFSGSVIILNNSTVSGNSAHFGGGLLNSRNWVTLNNSTVSGNTASYGGGLLNFGSTVSLNNSTLAENRAYSGGNLYNYRSDLLLRNSIIANNRAGGDCSFSNSLLSVNTSNWFGDASCDGTADGSPKLGPLQDNGGTTWTHALEEGSGAIDRGNDAVCSGTDVHNVDQRGVRRPQGRRCDIGAYEQIYHNPNSSFFYIPLKNGKIVIFSL